MTISSVNTAYGDQLSRYRQQLEQQQETGRTAERQPQRQTQAAAQPQSQTDTAHFSAQARLLAEARTAASNAPDVREDKVAALRAQVQAGTYQPDSRAIASNLLQEEQAIFGA